MEVRLHQFRLINSNRIKKPNKKMRKVFNNNNSNNKFRFNKINKFKILFNNNSNSPNNKFRQFNINNNKIKINNNKNRSKFRVKFCWSKFR